MHRQYSNAAVVFVPIVSTCWLVVDAQGESHSIWLELKQACLGSEAGQLPFMEVLSALAKDHAHAVPPPPPNATSRACANHCWPLTICCSRLVSAPPEAVQC
jgi:hypothetical protein